MVQSISANVIEKLVIQLDNAIEELYDNYENNFGVGEDVKIIKEILRRFPVNVEIDDIVDDDEDDDQIDCEELDDEID